MAGLLVGCSMPQRSKARECQACIRSVMLQGAETWPLPRKLIEELRASNRRILRCMARMRWQSSIFSADIANRLGVENLETVMRKGRLRWSGHITRAGKDTVLVA